MHVRGKNKELEQDFYKNGKWDIAYTYSHSHLAPANKNIMAALLTIKDWDNVIVEGDLIDIEFIDGRHYRTSMSRNDPYKGDRGCGSCETVFVRKLIINNKI